MAIFEMMGSYMRANHLSCTSASVKWQLNFTPRYTDARSWVWKEGKETHRKINCRHPHPRV